MKIILTFLFIAAISAIAFGQHTTLTALFEKEKNVVKLRWQHDDETVSSYTVQRSNDNTNFKDISVKKTTDISDGEFMKYTDDKIYPGKNYYRLKLNRGTMSALITPPVMVIQGNTENKWVMYPVPVGDILNLQYAGSGALQGVITVLIQSVYSGTVFTKLRLASTSRSIQIPVTNIGKGIYDIRIYVGNDAVWNRRFEK